MAFESFSSSLALRGTGLGITGFEHTTPPPRTTGRSRKTGGAPAADGDTMHISEEASRALRLAVSAGNPGIQTTGQTTGQAAGQAAAQTAATPWETHFGLTSGSTTLKNGNTQVTTIDGATMERLEYESGVLVRKETGVIAGGRAVWDTEDYGLGGAVIRKAHAELTGLGGTAAGTMASLRRDVQWFEDGTAVRELHDGMSVQASSVSAELVGGDALDEAATLEDMAATLTRDDVASDYQAEIVEYAGGKVSRSASIHSRLEAENITNRTSSAVDGLAAWSTRELANATAVTVQFTTYDAQGGVLLHMRLTDSVVAGKSLTQTVAASWYDQGELVRQEEGTLTMSPGKGRTLPDRPGILETFGIDETTFSGATPLSAGGLLAASREKTAGAAGAFVNGLDSDMASGGFSLAETLARHRGMDNPYSLRFTSRTYRDGELAAESTDTEAVRENRMPGQPRFETGKGLTEDEIPAMLRAASHEETAYENGVRMAHGELSLREFVQKDGRGVFGLYTHYTGEAGIGADLESLSGTRKGSLEGLDSEANAASSGMGRTAALSVDGARALFRGLGEA